MWRSENSLVAIMDSLYRHTRLSKFRRRIKELVGMLLTLLIVDVKEHTLQIIGDTSYYAPPRRSTCHFLINLRITSAPSNVPVNLTAQFHSALECWCPALTSTNSLLPPH